MTREKPNGDCISREYILSFLEGEVMGDDDYIAGMNDEQREIREVVRNAPSVVPTTEQSSMVGEWIEEVGDCEGKSVRYICSQCGDDDGWINYNYCPNCGAKMKGAV